jgi:hypothetical protein
VLTIEEQFNVDMAIGTAITSWAHLETEMMKALVIFIKAENQMSLAAAFFAVENFRSKLGMLNAAATLSLSGNPELANWKSLTRRIEKLSVKRNHIAHYQILHFVHNEAGKRVILRPNIWNPSGPPIEGTFPEVGYRLIDLQNMQRDFSAVNTTLRNFNARLLGQEPLPDGFPESALHTTSLDNPLRHIRAEYERQRQAGEDSWA